MMKTRHANLLTGIFLTIIFRSFTASAADYYVSPSGNDANDGLTKKTPWATITKVNNTVFTAGDRILFEGGKTFTGSIIIDSIDGGTVLKPIILSTFFSFEGVNANGKDCAKIFGGDRNGIVISGASDIKIDRLWISGSGRNNNVRGYGILVDNGKNIVIDNIEVEGFQIAGVMIYGGSSDVRVTNVYAHDNGYTGIGAGYKKAGLNKNLYIGYCRTIHNQGISDPTRYIGDQSGSGIHVANAEDVIIEYCESADNGGDFYHTGGNGPVGIWMNSCRNVIVQYCISHNNKSKRLGDGHIYADGGGFDFDSGSKNCLYQYCYSYENAGPGFLLCAWNNTEAHRLEDNTIRYCISVDDGLQNGGGIWIWHSENQKNMQVYNNIFYNSSGRSCIEAPGVEGSFFFRNNIFIVRGTGSFVKGMGPGAVFQGNCYWNYNNPGNWDGAASLEEWRKRGYEMLNNKPAGLNEDPRLIFRIAEQKLADPTLLMELNEYSLKPGSPCIDAGMDLLKFFGVNPGNLDILKNNLPQGKAYDIGPMEY